MKSINWNIAAPLLVVIAGICWGLIGLFSQSLASFGLSAMQITVVRNVIAMVSLGLCLLIANPRAFVFRLRDIWLFLGTGIVSIAFFNVCYFACIELCNLSTAAILLYTAPCFVTILSAVLFHEAITPQKLIALILAMLGCCFVVGIGTGEMAFSVVGILLGFGSGIGYALYSIFSRVALRTYTPWTIMFYTFTAASLALLPFSAPDVIIFKALDSPYLLAMMLSIGLISTLLPFACYTTGLKHMETSKASIMAFVEPVVALFIGVTVFHDILTPLNCCGVLLILISVVLLNLVVGKRKQKLSAAEITLRKTEER